MHMKSENVVLSFVLGNMPKVNDEPELIKMKENEKKA